MLSERVYLSNDKRAYIDTYVVGFKNIRRDEILVIPGGGYADVCNDREGEMVAYAYLSKGYIWHTAEDNLVPPIGSITLATRYIEEGAPVSIHIYPYGRHGISLATPLANHSPDIAEPLAERWLADSVDFLNSIK